MTALPTITLPDGWADVDRDDERFDYCKSVAAGSVAPLPVHRGAWAAMARLTPGNWSEDPDGFLWLLWDAASLLAGYVRAGVDEALNEIKGTGLAYSESPAWRQFILDVVAEAAEAQR